MGTRGPKALDPETRRLRHSKNSGAKVAPWPLESVLPEPPPHLNGRAAELWAEVGPELAEAGLICCLYKRNFASLCCAWAGQEELEEDLAGLPRGSEERYTTRRLLLQYTKLARDLSAEFGLSPSMKGRVQAERRPPLAKNDPWAKFDSTPPNPNQPTRKRAIPPNGRKQSWAEFAGSIGDKPTPGAA